jgi:hypothetical protein
MWVIEIQTTVTEVVLPVSKADYGKTQRSRGFSASANLLRGQPQPGGPAFPRVWPVD